MATDQRQEFRTLTGRVSAVSIEQARHTANKLNTKLLVDATKEEVDQYNHRFGTHYKHIK